jgi:hypothetical protein
MGAILFEDIDRQSFNGILWITIYQNPDTFRIVEKAKAGSYI